MSWNDVELHWRHMAERLKQRLSRLGHSERTPTREAPHLDAKLRRAYGIARDAAAKDAEHYCQGR